VKDELPPAEGRVFSYVCDLTDNEQIEATIERTVKECPPVDILINNVRSSVSFLSTKLC
jgi:NAD(P)-dependent dehydrogenase (short-subunit alcohol dehydrogenase family)